MSNSEQYHYLCGILSKLVDSDLTADELRDLASALGISVSDFCQPYEILDLFGGNVWTP